MAAAAPPTPTAQSTAAASATSPTTASGQSVSSAAPDAPWWNGWERRTLPDEENVSALREIWGRTGGRLRKWKREQGWKPPPPLKSPADVASDETERQQLRRLYGAELQYKPAFGVLWREGFVSKVELPKNGLEGPVPPQLEGLGRCRVVCLFGNRLAGPRAGKESEIPNFKGSYLGRFPLVSADFWTSDHLLERSRSADGTLARGTLKLKRT